MRVVRASTGCGKLSPYDRASNGTGKERRDQGRDS
jgi:hypothetical protein